MAAFGDKVYLKKFQDLCKESIDEQRDLFTRRFVFALGDQYSDVMDLSVQFKEACEADESGGGDCLSHAGASGFLQAQGKTRTAQQRRGELNDIDVNKDGKISFIEYLLLHYKVMILKEYFARNEMEPDVDLDNDGIGLTGVGERLCEELFNVPQGIDKDLEAMMKEFSVEHAKRQEKIAKLQATVDKGGVKGMAAKNELEQLKQQDQTDVHAVEARIAAAVKKAQAKAKKELDAKNLAALDAEKEKLAGGRNKMAEKMAKFGKRVSQRLSLGRK